MKKMHNTRPYQMCRIYNSINDAEISCELCTLVLMKNSFKACLPIYFGDEWKFGSPNEGSNHKIPFIWSHEISGIMRFRYILKMVGNWEISKIIESKEALWEWYKSHLEDQRQWAQCKNKIETWLAPKG